MAKKVQLKLADAKKLITSDYVVADFNDEDIEISKYHEDVREMIDNADVINIYADDDGYIRILIQYDEFELDQEQKWFDMSDDDREYERYLIAKDI